MHDNNCIGVMCCAIFHMGNEREMSGNISTDHKHRIPPVNLRTDLVIDQSDHMWLFYLSRRDFHAQSYYCRWYKSYNGVISVKFKKLIIDNGQICTRRNQYVKVYAKKYGYRWVYKQDRQLQISGT